MSSSTIASKRKEEAEEKIGKLIRLAKKAKEDELNAIPLQFQEEYFNLVQRAKLAMSELDMLPSSGQKSQGEHRQAQTASGETGKWYTSVQKKSTGGVSEKHQSDSRRAGAFTASGMKPFELKERGHRPARASDRETDTSLVPGIIVAASDFFAKGHGSRLFTEQNGSKSEAEALLNKYANSTSSIPPGTNPYSVALALLMFFERLPSAFIQSELSKPLEELSTIRMQDANLPHKIQGTVSRMANTQRETLKVLCGALALVAEEEETTRMSGGLLSEMIAPVIFRTNSRVNNAFEGMMVHHSFVFAATSEHRVYKVVNEKGAAVAQDAGSMGYVDNRYNYISRGWS